MSGGALDGGVSLLWTVMPPEVVLGSGAHGLAGPLAAMEPSVLELRIGGRVLQVEPGPHGTGTVRRLISADPLDYLNPSWQPGAVMALFPPPQG